VSKEPLGCVSCVVHQDDHDATSEVEQNKKKVGYVGYYIVLPEHRGKGYGIACWNHGMLRMARFDFLVCCCR